MYILASPFPVCSPGLSLCRDEGQDEKEGYLVAKVEKPEAKKVKIA